MTLVTNDSQIKYLNASFISKLRDYNIIIPSLTIPSVPSQEAFKEAVSDTGLGDSQWIDDALACMDIAYRSCKGCDTAQTDYGQCNAGCFGANTCGACVSVCNGGDAVCISCNAQTDDSEVIVCESCNTGCEGCNEACYGCNSGCQGAQTCTSCNTGQEIPCEYTAGCTDCQEGHEHTDPTWGCDRCVHACVAPDNCGARQVPTVPGCITGNTCTESHGEDSCTRSYSSSDSGEVTCREGYSDAGTQCNVGFTVGYDGIGCMAGYSSGATTCESLYAASGGEYCLGHYSDSACGQTCVNGYGTTCLSCNEGDDHCLNCVSSQDTCTACVNGEAATCTSCVESQSCSDCQGCDSGCNADVSCNGYSVGDNGQNICVGNFTDTNCGQTCVGGFDSSTQCLSGQGCSSCDTCQGCDSCQGSDGSCTSGDSCTSCDSGCQSCDSGCYNTCNDCQGCVNVNCTGNWGVCGQIVPPTPSTGD